jgi:hypothetical protein
MSEVYSNPQKFRRDKLSVKKLTESLFAEIWGRPKVCHAETFGMINFF